MISLRTSLLAALGAALFLLTLLSMPALASAAAPDKMGSSSKGKISYACDSGKLEGRECILRKRFGGKEISFWNGGSEADEGRVVAAMIAGCKKAGYAGGRTPHIDGDYKGEGRPYGQGYITCTKPAEETLTCPKHYTAKEFGDSKGCFLTSCPQPKIYEIKRGGTEAAKCIRREKPAEDATKPSSSPAAGGSTSGGSTSGGSTSGGSTSGGSTSGGSASGGSPSTKPTKPAKPTKPTKPAKPATCKDWQTAKDGKCIDKPCPKSTKKNPLKRDPKTGKCVAPSAGSGSSRPAPVPSAGRPSNASGSGVVNEAPPAETQTPHPNYEKPWGPSEGGNENVVTPMQ